MLAKSFARIHWQNLVNFGVLPLTFQDLADYDRLEMGDTVEITGVADALAAGREDHRDRPGRQGDDPAAARPVAAPDRGSCSRAA